MSPDTLGGVATSNDSDNDNDNRTVSHPTSLSLHRRSSETPSATSYPSSAATAASVVASASDPRPRSPMLPRTDSITTTASSTQTLTMSKSTTETVASTLASPPPIASPTKNTDTTGLDFATDRNGLHQHQQTNHPSSQHTSGSQQPSQSYPRSETNSQESTMTSSSDQALTPTTDTSNGHGPSNGLSLGHAAPHSADQLHQLSTLAAAQNKMPLPDAVAGSRKRMADGEVKPSRGSTSPIKGHSRNASAISMASTGSNIGELSSELKTRLTYAMVKLNNGWQAHSIEEVETLTSQVASPTSSTSTAHRRHKSSASPRVTINPQVHFATDALIAQEMKATSPSTRPPNGITKSALAPPAPIQPFTNTNPRRNSNSRYVPALLSAHSNASSTSPRTPGQPPRLNISQARSQDAEPMIYSPRNPKNIKEQAAIETLVFMSSPGHSANLKHTFSPTGSPGPQAPAPRPPGGRHALPSGPRKMLPTQRPQHAHKKSAIESSPRMPPPGSPMDLDSPQQYATPNRGTPRRRTIGSTGYSRTPLSLPSGLVSHAVQRKPLRDDDIERMLDHASAAQADSSDDEEIQLPHRRNGAVGASWR
ncbi:hypothetical protein B0I35DRAFT_425137 [Stachybotrys elegans]|uniref:Uncharacterized protein n=1 Tax=Stachybotrys elegans TaxID=80388 RepID=A0A8K0SZQ8_9HYPO|nr:hypothetical protein B0I35DRAFT_425137 [Stachybotrys elegans]